MGKQVVSALILVVLASPHAYAQTVTGTSSIETRLHEADRRAWLTDWYGALEIYSDVEKRATAAGDRRDAMYAKFGLSAAGCSRCR